MKLSEAKKYLKMRFEYETELYAVMAEGVFTLADLEDMEDDIIIDIAIELKDEFKAEYYY